MNDEHGKKPKEKKIEVTVFAPRATEPKKFNWAAKLTVGAAAAEAAEAFGYAPGQPTLARGEHTLDREETLHAAGVKDGDKLELVDIGGGV